MKIIDTHQHLWDLDRLDYPWLKDVPVLNRSFSMQDYLEATEGLQIEQSVHVEADVAESLLLEETRYIVGLAEERENPLKGVVAGGRPESTDFTEYLDQIRNYQSVKGIRRVLHTQPDDLGRQPEFIQNVTRLEEYGLSFDVCVLERQLPVALNLIKTCPGVQFVLDHCGVPDVKQQKLDPWRERMAEIARCQNVACKVSGLVAYADPDHWKPEDLRPYVIHVIDCFGWDRVMFGSDWPVCTLASSYRKWVDALVEIVGQAEEANQRKLFSENARRLYRL